MSSYNKLYLQYRKLYSIYLEELTLFLNHYHKKQYNKYYWEPIIGIFLRKFITNFLILNKYNKKKFFKKTNFKNFKFSKSYSEFAQNKEQPLFKFENITKYKDYRIKKINFFSKKLNSFKTLLPNILIKMGITKIFFQESYFKKSLKNLFVLKSAMYLNSLPSLQLEKFNVDKEKILQNRLNLIRILKRKNKKDLLLQNLIFYMPINYIENYNLILKELNKIRLSEALYIDGNEVKFDYIKFYIAKLALNKKKIITGQHSLRTGLEDFDIYFDYSKSISNYYFTWGWANKKDSIIKYSSTRIFSSLRKYKKIELDNMNFDKVNICFILCSFGILGECLHDNLFENLKAEKARIDLLEKIKIKKNNKISLKPREGSFLLKNKKKFYNNFNLLKNKTRMYDIFGNYNIVIY